MWTEETSKVKEPAILIVNDTSDSEGEEENKLSPQSYDPRQTLKRQKQRECTRSGRKWNGRNIRTNTGTFSTDDAGLEIIAEVILNFTLS